MCTSSYYKHVILLQEKRRFSLFRDSSPGLSIVGLENSYFLLADHKLDFIAPCGANKSISWPPSKKNRVRYGKNINFTRVTVTLALLGHQTSHSQNKFLFLQLHNILYNTLEERFVSIFNQQDFGWFNNINFFLV